MTRNLNHKAYLKDAKTAGIQEHQEINDSSHGHTATPAVVADLHVCMELDWNHSVTLRNDVRLPPFIPALLCVLAYEYFPPHVFITGLLPGLESLVRFG